MHTHSDKMMIQEIIGTAEAMGQAMTPQAAAMIAGDLEGVPFQAVAQALRDVRASHRGRLTFAVIRERILTNDGRPDREEAWALALESLDERASVVWTREIAAALQAAKPVLAAKDKVGARMAFLSAYDRLVSVARDARQPAEWELSQGWDVDGRRAAIEKAVMLCRLPMERALALGYQPGETQRITADGAAIAGLLTAPDTGLLLTLTEDRETREALAREGRGGDWSPSPGVADRLKELRRQMVENIKRRHYEREEARARERLALEDKKRQIAEKVEALLGEPTTGQ